MAEAITKKRNTVLDFAKGLTILLMLWEHLYPGNSWIMTFHMPLFFIISGYFLKEESFKTTVIKKAKGLLIPYFVMEFILIVSLVIYTAIQNHYTLQGDKSWMWHIITVKLRGTFLVENMCISWFVWVLFGGTCLYALINKLMKKLPVIYAMLIIACSIIGYVVSNDWGFYPYRWDVVLYVIPFIAIGHLYKLYGEELIQGYVRWILLGVSLVVWLVDIYFTDSYSIAMCHYGIYPLTLIGAICGTYVVINICSLLDRIPVLNTVIRWYGRNTLVIMCFAVVVSNAMEWYYENDIKSAAISFVIQLAIVSLLIAFWNSIKGIIKSLKKD